MKYNLTEKEITKIAKQALKPHWREQAIEPLLLHIIKKHSPDNLSHRHCYQTCYDNFYKLGFKHRFSGTSLMCDNPTLHISCGDQYYTVTGVVNDIPFTTIKIRYTAGTELLEWIIKSPDELIQLLRRIELIMRIIKSGGDEHVANPSTD